MAMELSDQVNRNATIVVMGSFILAIGIHQHISKTKGDLDLETCQPSMSLQSLPYDVILSIVQHLDYPDVKSLQDCSSHFRQYMCTPTVYRNFALDLLRRNRPLPLNDFQRLDELTIEELVPIVSKGFRLERSWVTGTLKPATSLVRPSQYLTDGKKPVTSWYNVIDAPITEGEGVDWMHSITARLMLCATKTGRVMCWDIHDPDYIQTWQPEDRWELWKCRVEYDTREVLCVMSKFGEDDLEMPPLTELLLVRIDLTNEGPVFSTFPSYTIPGQAQNVFILDAPRRYLAAYVCIIETDCIGLFCQLDWSKDEYIFIDTNIPYAFPPNWTCILQGEEIVVHCEDQERITQHCYPITLLQQYARRLSPSDPIMVFRTVPAPRIITRPFLLPSSEEDNPLPIASPLWYPEGAHFIRQWWPTHPSIPKLSSTVFIFIEEDAQGPEFIRRATLCQHYFDVPITGGVEQSRSHEMPPIDDDKPIARMWFVSVPFEPVCEIMVEEHDGDGFIGRCHPLVAIDFQHAVWIEWVLRPDGVTKHKELRFVSFPPVVMDNNGVTKIERGVDSCLGLEGEVEGRVVSLPVPEELDLDLVETINIDQSQGAILLSIEGGKVFILCYD